MHEYYEKKKKKIKPWMKYSGAIMGALASTIFNEDSEFFISDLDEDDNMTEFLHAVLNSIPTMIYNSFAGEEKTQIEVNHVANILCFLYSKNIEESKSINN